MPPKKKPAPEAGRKSAYVARNRATIINAALEVLAENGLHATMDQVAEASGMAMSTVYKHFKDKDELVATVLLEKFMEWEAQVTEKNALNTDLLEQLVFPMRMFVRIPQTHPSQAKVFVSHFGVIASITPMLEVQLIAHVKDLTKAKMLTAVDPKAAAKNLQAIIAFAVVNQVINPKYSVADADMAIQAGLSMLGISDAKAKKLTEAKLPL
jgi:AcrR family transcriptional regulator